MSKNFDFLVRSFDCGTGWVAGWTLSVAIIAFAPYMSLLLTPPLHKIRPARSLRFPLSIVKDCRFTFVTFELFSRLVGWLIKKVTI